MADTKPETDVTAQSEQNPKPSTTDATSKSDKVDNTSKTEPEKKEVDATVEKKEDKNANKKTDNASETKGDKATNEMNKVKDDETTEKGKNDTASNKSDDAKKNEPVNKKDENVKAGKNKENEKTNKKNDEVTTNNKPGENKSSKKPDDDKTSKKTDEEKVNKKNDPTNSAKKNDTSKVANNVNKTVSEGGKPRSGSAGSQGKNNQSNEQKMKRRQKEQERYQRKIQRGENKNANKEGGAQKATPKTEEKKDSGGLSITVGGQGRTVTEKKDGKTVVEKKGENAIEAPETKQGGDALTEEEKTLEEHQIFRLAKKSLRFPKAKFYCRYCNYHLDTVDLAFKHVDESRHSKLEKTKKDQEFLRTLPPASDAHHQALTNLLTSVVDKHKLTQKDLDDRALIVPRIEQVLRKELPKCQVRLYGSSVSGFGFKGSNVNLDIMIPPEVTPAEILVGADRAMHKHSSEVFTDVETDFEGKFPCINFKDKKTGLQCQVGTNSQFAVDTSKLLHEYYKLDARVPVLALALRYWAQLCKVDQQADGSMPAYAFVLMVIHYLQQCDPPVLPVIQEKETLKERNPKSAGELWLDLLKFYVVETPIEEWVITIRNRKPISRQDMKIPNKRLAVEDPYATSKKNITKSLTTSIVFQYIMERLREALKYFGLPQYLPGKEPTASNCYSWFVHSKSPTNKTPGEKDKTTDTTDTVDALAKDLSKKLVTEHSESHRTNAEGTPKDVTDAKTPSSKTDGNKDAADAQKFGPSVSDFNFVFEKQMLTGGEEVPLICSGCGVEGHVEKDCQDEVLIDLIPLPPMPPNFMRKIDLLCVNICEEVQAQRWEMDVRDNIIWELQTHIRRNGFPDTNLRLFGSSMNGFGFHHSDLDICMTLKPATDPKSLNFPDIVEKLAKILKKNRSLYAITPIPTAKVPIVKFVHRPSRLEGDISLYNMLAQVNTKMLFCYSSIDTRVRQLVYTFKLFAKICDIGDASKGSLSSYAYTLMTLFFLQQRKPPVIPVLQELHAGKETPKNMMEGWNAWFFEDMRSLPRVWKDCGKNRESVGQLWLGMMRFFTEDFDFKKYVITIRQLKLLTRFEKMWTAPSRGFAIEDPFDLDHNLGGGVSRKMATYMMQVLRKTRERFGLPRRIPPYTDDFDYFFDVDFLSDGKAPPNDRGCRVCGKIGHFVKECPRRRPKSGDSNDRKREDGKGTPSKQTRDTSPRKAEPQKSTPQKVSSDNTQSSKETPKKPAPEKEILKRDTSQQKTTPNGKAAATPVSVTPVMSNSKAAQIHNTRPATLTPTTKPLIPPSTSTATTQASTGNKGGSAGGAGKEAGDGTTTSEKQRTSSIGDTWEQHKTGKKTSKKKKKKSQDDSVVPQQTTDNQTKVPTSQATTPTIQGTPQPSMQSPATTQASAQKTPAPKTTQAAAQQSASATNQRAGILPITHLNQANKQNAAPGGYPKGGANQKMQGQGMQQQFKGQQGMQQQKGPQVGQQQKGPQGAPQKGQQGMQQQGVGGQKGPQQRNQQQQGIQQRGPQGIQQQQQQRNPQGGILSWMPPGMIAQQQKGPQQQLQQQQQQQQRVPPGPKGNTPNQKPYQNTTSPQKTPYNNPNQKYPQQRENQKTPQQVAQKAPVQQGQKGKGQQNQQGKNQQKGQQKTPQKNASLPGEPAVPALAQGIGTKNAPFSKKRLPKAPNLSQQQQQDSQKALLEQMGQGLMQMLQADKAQRTALKKSEIQQQMDTSSLPRHPQFPLGNKGDTRGQGPGGGGGGAFQKYPVQPPQIQQSGPPSTSTVASSPHKVTSSAPGPATFQSNLPIGHNAGDSYNKQPSPTDLGFPATNYQSYESPQRSSPSAIGRSPPKFPVQPPMQHSPGTVGIRHPRMTSPGMNASDILSATSSIYQPMRYPSIPKSEISPPSGITPMSHHNQSRFIGTQSPVEINQFQIPREEPELPVFGSSPSKNAVNVERSPPGFMGGSGGTGSSAAPGEHLHQHQQHSLHHNMGLFYPMEHFGQGNVPGSAQDTTKSSPRDYHAQMFQQGRSPEDVNPYAMMGNQHVPLGMRAAMARYSGEESPQGYNPDRQAPGNQPQSLATSSGLGMSPAKFQVGGGGSLDTSPWLQYSSMAQTSATSQTPMRYPTSNNMSPFGNLNASPGTPPFLNYSAPGNPYASNPSQLVSGMPPSPPSNQLQQASAVFGTNNPSQLGVSPSPPNTQLFQSNLFGAPGVIGSPAGAPYTSSPATMHMLTNDSGLGLGYANNESSGVSQGSVGDRLYREAVTLATTSSTYPAFPGGTASNAAIPTHINVHPKPTVLPYATPTYAPHQMTSVYNSEGQPIVHSEVEGQGVIGQSPR